MEISVEHRDQVTVVAIVGSIDALTAGALTDALNAQVGEGRTRLVANLSQVTYTSSAGLLAMLSALNETRRHKGDLRLAGVQENVRRVLDLSGFTNILKLYPDVEGAVASFAD